MTNVKEIKRLLIESFTLKKLVACLLFAVLPAALFYIISLAVLKSAGFTFAEVLKEPAQITQTSSLIGFLSNIGNGLWVSAISICFFTLNSVGESISKKQKELLFLVGLLSFFLVIDDFFMLHDRYLNEIFCYLVYMISALLLLVRHYDIILKIGGFAFLIAGTFLALSIFIDVIQDIIEIPKSQLFEEGFKFIGITSWLYFTILAAKYRLEEARI